jgi:signal transduction histidine kinase/CheY-like chemotaxis protein
VKSQASAAAGGGSRSRELQGLSTRRALLLAGAVAYALFWFADRQAGAAQEPFWGRALLVAPIVATLLGSYRSAWFRAHLPALLLSLSYMITAHVFALLVVNELDRTLVLGIFVTLAGFIAVSTHTLTSTRQLSAYFLFVGAATLISVAVVHHPRTEALYLCCAIGTIAALGYVTVRGQLLTLHMLADSERELSHDNQRRIEVEQALRASESRSRALVQAVPDVMLVVDAAGAVLEVFDQQGSALGERAKKLTALRDPLWRLFSSVECRATRDAIATAIETRTPQTIEQELRDAEGGKRVEIRIAAISEAAALVLLRDVTDQRAMEANLRMTERLAALGTLASAVAHEINNPLAYVAGNVDFVLRELETNQSTTGIAQDLLAALAEAREGTERIKNIVRDLKEQARSDEQSLGATDVNQAVLAALRVLDNQLKHRTRLEVELAEVPSVQANSGRLVQIVTNLLTNAADAMLERPMSENAISVRSLRVGEDGVAIEVRDNGTGIPAHVLGKIFDPFFTTKPQGKGTGLGLHVCHKLVTSFGGAIEVQSRSGEGTLMRVVLRCAALQPAAAQTPVPNAALGGVLVLDDDVLVARSLTRMLRGQEVRVAHDVDTALALCRERDFDLLLCDLMLPGKNGADFYEALKTVKPALVPRIVFLTGGVFTAPMEKFVASLPNPCLFKPLDRKALAHVLSRLPNARTPAALAS